MDAHFVRPKVAKRSNNSDFSRLFKIVRSFVPVFVLAATLPILIGLVLVPPQLSFFTNADTEPELRVWFEPSSVIVSPGKQVSVEVYSQFSGESKLIPEIYIPFISTEGVDVDKNNLVYSTPYRGKVKLGEINVKAVISGESSISIAKDQIKITAFEGPLDIKTSDLDVIVR